MFNPFARKPGAQQGSRRLSSAGSAESPAHLNSADAALDGRPCSDIAEIEMIGPTAVVTLTVTELVGADAAERLADLLDHLGEYGATNLIADVQNVQVMDSACLNIFVEAVRVLDRVGGRIALVNADRSVQYLFRLTRLDRVFPICTDVMSALAAVERPAGR